jgi:hypothetical protein
MTFMLEELLAEPEGWPMVLTLLRSEQIPAPRMAEIFHEHPDFAKWVKVHD